MPSLEPVHPRVSVLMQRTSSFVADGITPGFTVRYAHPPRSPQHLTHGLAALHVLRLSLSFGPSRSPSGLVGLVLPLLRPLLTSRSGTSRRPFRHKTRSPQVRTHTFIAQPPHLRRLTLVTRALWFLAHSPCLAAPSMRFLFIGSRFMLRASFPRSVALTQLRFTFLTVTSSQRDLHPQVCAHAGRTRKTP